MADVKSIIVDHLINMHKEIFTELKKSDSEITKHKINQYELMKQFQSLTQSLKDIAVSFSPKDDQPLDVNKA